MTKATSSSQRLTRRGFLKATSAVAGATALTGGTLATVAFAEGEDASEAGAEEEVYRGVCRPNCFGFCHLNVHVHDGRVMKTTRAPYNEPCYSRICQRGLSHVERIYDPKRLQYPLRRVEGTERGAGQWERISWDEALTELADKIKEIQGKYGESAVGFYTGTGNQSVGVSGIYGRLVSLLNASRVNGCVDQASFYGMSAVAGVFTGPLLGYMMWNANEPTDAKNANSIVVWGANITDAQIQNWHIINEAHEAGVKLVVVDPIYTQLASKADLWVPIRPGSDTLLKFGLMQIVLDREAEDVEYLKSFTVAPFLVKSSDGMFLRRSDTGVAPVDTGEVDPKTQQPIMDDPFMVLSGGKLVELRDGVDPDIEGEYMLDGVKCRCAFELLKENIYEYSLEQISSMTDIPMETINELADIVIDCPVYHYEGYGPQAYYNGAQTTVSGLTLCALLGNLGKPGATYGAFWGVGMAGSFGDPTYGSPEGPSTGVTIASLDFENVVDSGEFLGKPTAIKMLWFYTSNGLNTHTNTGMFINKFIAPLEFVVTIDSMMTDTASYSDLVLPVAQWFEMQEVANAGQTMSYNFNEKAIDPPYECKSDFDIITELAPKLGLEKYFTMTNEEALELQLSGPMLEQLGTDYKAIKEAKQVRFILGDPETEPYIAYKDGIFATPSKRFEFYRENVTPRVPTTMPPTEEQIKAERLPHFEPPNEAWPENPLYEKYPFVLMSERPRYRVHSQWFATPLLREIDPEPIVKINPADAQARGIEDQSYVECFNDRGTAVAKAIYSEAIKPGTMVYPKGWQLDQHKGGGWSYLSSSVFNPFTVNSNFMDVLCDVRPWEGGEA